MCFQDNLLTYKSCHEKRPLWVFMNVQDDSNKAPRAGFEPATNRLTVDRSTAELPRNIKNLTLIPTK